jgi:hypothetical protein
MSDPRDWDLEYDGAAPALPREMERQRTTEQEKEWADRVQARLPQGSYLVWFEPRIHDDPEPAPLPRCYCGILRIRHRLKPSRRAQPGDPNGETNPLLSSGSGDLYSGDRKYVKSLIETCKTRSEKDPEGREKLKGLRFPIERYRYYFRLETLWVTEPGESDDDSKDRWGLVLGFDTFFYDETKAEWSRRQPLTLRLNEARLRKVDGAVGEGVVGEEKGTVYNSLGTEVGSVGLLRVSDFVRHAVVHFHHLENLEAPNDEDTWEKTLAPAGWTVNSTLSESIEEDHEVWTENTLQAYHESAIDQGSGAPRPPMSGSLAAVAGTGLPPEWNYHLLILNRMVSGGQEGKLGYMYDLGGEPGAGDRPREGAAVYALEPVREHFPADGAGSGSGLPELRADPELFHWVALHEFGHMQGLYHNPSERSLMQPRHHRGNRFDKNRDLKYAEADLQRLWHLPDAWVRPGGVPFSHRYRRVAVEIGDLIPLTPRVDLEVRLPSPVNGTKGLRQNLACGNTLDRIELEVRHRLRDVFFFPNEQSLNPEQGRVAITLHNPAGEPVVVYPERFPRVLRQEQEIRVTRSARMSVDLPSRAAHQDLFDQVGFYRLELHVSWLGRENNEFFHVKGDTVIRVL